MTQRSSVQILAKRPPWLRVPATTKLDSQHEEEIGSVSAVARRVFDARPVDHCLADAAEPFKNRLIHELGETRPWNSG